MAVEVGIKNLEKDLVVEAAEEKNPNIKQRNKYLFIENYLSIFYFRLTWRAYKVLLDKAIRCVESSNWLNSFIVWYLALLFGMKHTLYLTLLGKWKKVR